MNKRQVVSRRVVRWLALTTLGVVTICLASPLATFAATVEPPPSGRLELLSAMPAAVQLGGKSRQQQFIVTLRRVDGMAADVTHHCSVTVADETVANVEQAVVRGVGNGRTKATIRYGDLVVELPITVEDFETYPSVYFASDVVPLLTKYGCNSGGCHGKQTGQNGFKLSVFGFDPPADYVAITSQSRGRRIFPAAPARSLLLRKAMGQVPHGGGQRIAAASPDSQLLTEWIRQGHPLKNVRADAASLAEVRVFPAECVLNAEQDQQLLVTAVSSDGSHRDVTSDAAYASNAEFIAGVERQGLVRAGKNAGEAGITISYMGHVAVARILIPRYPVPEVYPDLPANNRIDELVWAKLKKVGIVPSDLCDDATFLRRLYLDTIGTLPTPGEVRTFLADNQEDKRTRAIDTVMEREEYADYWSQRWADILLVDRDKLGERGSYQFYRWLHQQIEQNRPYDEWVRELLTASGSSAKYGPVNFFRALLTPEERTRAVSQAFMGVRLDCAQCHHHPYDKWSPQDFYGLAGYFNGLDVVQVGPGRELVFHRGVQPTTLPRTGEVVPTRPPGGSEATIRGDDDPRVELAAWLTDKRNPWFSRIVANRLWKHFLGRGLIEPEDDLRLTNPATNELLLQYLEDELVDGDFDLKRLQRLILNSRVYQLSSVPNETNAEDVQNFSHYTVKRLRAEVLLDAVCQVTGTTESFPGMPQGTRAIQLWDNRFPSYFLEIFGRSQRTSPCECGESGSPTIPQALHLMNAPEINDKIAFPEGRISQLLERKASRAEIIEELCLAALGRPPHEKERRVAERLFEQSQNERRAGEDFLWTLLNSYDFLFAN